MEGIVQKLREEANAMTKTMMTATMAAAAKCRLYGSKWREKNSRRVEIIG